MILVPTNVGRDNPVPSVPVPKKKNAFIALQRQIAALGLSFRNHDINSITDPEVEVEL